MTKHKLYLLIILILIIPKTYCKYQNIYHQNINLDIYKSNYKIRFNSNGGIGIMEDMNLQYGEIKPLNINKFTKNGYTFTGWNLSNGKHFNDGEDIANLSTIDNTIIDLYAEWKENIIYFQMPPDWNRNDIYVYMYNDEKQIYNATYPGIKATLIDSTKKIYSYRVDDNIKEYKNIIFSNIVFDKLVKQTVDLDFNINDLGKIYVPILYNNFNRTRIYLMANPSDSTSITLIKDNQTEINTINHQISGIGFDYSIDNKYNKFILHYNNLSTTEIEIPNYQDLTFQIMSDKRYYVIKYYYDCIQYDYEEWLNNYYNIWKNNDYLKFNERKRYY